MIRFSRWAVLSILIACFVVTPLLSADTVAGAVEAFDGPKLTNSVEANGLTFKYGHIEIKLLSGTATTLMAGDRTVGMFLKGQGSWRYVADEPAELPVVAYKTRKTTDLTSEKAAGGLVISDRFTTARIWVANVELPALNGTAAATPQVEFNETFAVTIAVRARTRL